MQLESHSIVDDAEYFYIAYEDGAVYETEYWTIRFPEKGVYFPIENGNYWGYSLTINGYTGFPKEQVKQEYLPGPDMIIEMIGTCGFETSEDLSSYCQIVSGNVVEIRSKLKKGEPVEAVIIGDAMFVSYDPSSLTLKSITVADLHDYLLIGFIVTTTVSTRRLRIAIDNDNNITMFESKSLD